MSDFRGEEGSKKPRLYKVKIGLRGGGGVKNDSKKSDIIYERSLILWFHHFLDSWTEIFQIFRWYFGTNDDTKGHFEIN